MNIAQGYEKVKIKDIFITLKDIFTENKNDMNKDILDQKLQEIYKVELEVGATDNIKALEKDIKNHALGKKVKNERTSKITTNKIVNEVKDKAIEKNAVNNENILDR